MALNTETNFAVVSSDRERLVNVIESGKFNYDRNKALDEARRLRDGWFNTMGVHYIIVECPHRDVNNCNEINNRNGFHNYPQVA